MNFINITEEEFNELNAKLDKSLEDISLSETEEEGEVGLLPEESPRPMFSVEETTWWKDFLASQQECENASIKQQKKFSSVFHSLRESTPHFQLESIPIPEEPPLEIPIEEEEEIPVLEEPVQEELQSEIESENNIQTEIENRKRECAQMEDNDFLSKIAEDWHKKQQIIAQEELERNQKATKEKEQLKKFQEEKRAERRRIEIKEKEAERIRIDQERIRLQEIEVQKKLEAEFKIKERQKEFEECKNMAIQDDNCKLLNRQWNQDLMQLLMEKEDQRSYLLRKLVPIPSTSQYTRKINLVPMKLAFPKEIILPCPEIVLTQPHSQKAKKIEAPQRLQVIKYPEIEIDQNTEQPTLQDLLPFPFNSKASSLQMKYEDLRSISGLQAFENLLELSLSLNKISKIQNLPPTLVKLELSHNLITVIPELDLPSLEHLILDMNQLTSVQGLRKCQNLITLSVNNNKLLSIQGLNENSLLQNLFAYRNKIKSIEKNTFSGNIYLQHLDLGRNKLREVSFLDSNKLLTSLILYENKISQISGLSLPILKELWLNGNSLKSLDFLVYVPSLEVLKLEDNNISSVCPFNCALLQNCNISFNNMNSFREVLAVMQSAPNLTHFSYNDNPFLANKHELVIVYTEIVVKSLPYIQELNNSPRTSLSVPSSSIDLRQLILNFYLSQQALYESKARRGAYVTKCTSEDMQDWILTNPSTVYNNLSTRFQTKLVTHGIQELWYRAKEQMHQHVRAALVIQVFWKYRTFKRKRLIKRFAPFAKEIIKLQAWFRGLKARKNTRKPKQRQATKIQALFRGFSLRKKLNRALEGAKVDIDLEEFEEVNLNDLNMNLDFDNELIIPDHIDLRPFLEEVKLPPLKQIPKTKSPFSKSNTVQEEQLPPLRKNKMQEQLDEWGVHKEELREVMKHRWAKERRRKNQKHLTADQRIQKFRKFANS